MYNISNWRCDKTICLHRIILIYGGDTMGSRGSSAGVLRAKNMTKTAAASDVLETVPSLIPKDIQSIKDPMKFGEAYARYYKTARGGNDSGRLAAAAQSTWIAKNDYTSNDKTRKAEAKVYNAAIDVSKGRPVVEHNVSLKNELAKAAELNKKRVLKNKNLRGMYK